MFVSILLSLLVLSILIIGHELGHFFAAKKAGVWVEEFGIGLPPRIWGKKIGETIYSVNWLPFGGFVRLHGENYDDDIKKPRGAFLNKSKKARALIITAGVVMNFVLAILAFFIVYLFTGIPRQTDKVKVIEVSAGSPAQEAGLLPGDVITKIGTQDVLTTESFVSLVEEKKGSEISITVDRDSSPLEVKLTPRIEHPKDEGPLGVVISSTEIYYPPLWQRPFLGIYNGFKEALFWGQTILVSLVSIIGGLFKGNIPQDVAGPVGIFAITNEAAKVGVLALINFVGIFSVNLAILNILPFPALDGGRLLFIAIEALIGKRVLPKVESALHAAGMVILIILLIALTFSDLKRLIVFGGLSGFLQSFVK
jgi:regulator of sigma E protease